MKKVIFVLATLLSLCTNAQIMNINMNDGRIISYRTNEIDNIFFDAEIDIEETPHDFVDLGLPSGTLWARCNIGADTPYQKGLLFAWAETATKYNYSWENYKYADGAENLLTKYNDSWETGESIDNKNILDLCDDAAYINWGGQWRIPSVEQWQELVDNCTWTFMTINGVKGYRVSSEKTNTSIFICLCSQRSDLSGYTEEGTYWAKELYSSTYAKCFSILYRDVYAGGSSASYKTSHKLRYIGNSIRPVKNRTKTNPTDE